MHKLPTLQITSLHLWNCDRYCSAITAKLLKKRTYDNSTILLNFLNEHFDWIMFYKEYLNIFTIVFWWTKVNKTFSLFLFFTGVNPSISQDSAEHNMILKLKPNFNYKFQISGSNKTINDVLWTFQIYNFS